MISAAPGVRGLLEWGWGWGCRTEWHGGTPVVLCCVREGDLERPGSAAKPANRSVPNVLLL
jgi:hypothetical protein